MHWTDRWIGFFAHEDFTCADFVQEVLEKEFGRRVGFPRVSGGRRAWDREIAQRRQAFGIPTIAPDDGDGVLMRDAARIRSGGWHMGLYVRIHHGAGVLHLPGDALSIVTPLDELGRLGLAVEGTYKWAAFA